MQQEENQHAIEARHPRKPSAVESRSTSDIARILRQLALQISKLDRQDVDHVQRSVASQPLPQARGQIAIDAGHLKRPAARLRSDFVQRRVPQPRGSSRTGSD
ncbi:MAG: hypothetical protein MZW92_80185 [Comamonadaceae bacterium]|nr:hypothetical protein [Comamonadaceae bacterium]